MPLTVYTDGACLGNPGGPGGWAWAVPDGAYASGPEPETTNQRMELTAALSAVRALDGPLEVVSDSTYVVNCFKNRWYESWERKGWKNSSRQPVANQDLWKPLIAAFHAREGTLTFRWVKGHGGDPMNNVVDRLAVEAARTQAGRSGAEPPTELGAPDSPTPGRESASSAGSAGSASSASSAGSSQGPSAPTGHRVVVLGHRPPELGGYDANPVRSAVGRKLTEILAGLRAVHPDLVVLTGLGLGAEQLGAEAAAEAGVPYVAVVAFPDPDQVWPKASRETYRLLVAGAADTVTVSHDRPATKQAAGIALARRNDWLVAQADGALVVWDGRERGIGATVRALEKRLPDDVWIIPPAS